MLVPIRFSTKSNFRREFWRDQSAQQCYATTVSRWIFYYTCTDRKTRVQTLQALNSNFKSTVTVMPIYCKREVPDPIAGIKDPIFASRVIYM
ncbi:unnamed protein product [Chondrus crispus]|uniref:Uncharacterized protein n=1 Tax=Chondrus crispus TaxID=2769 RepID=R7QD39_CHOCR|nr:unnamed protein product [Chondrus crispus]CDF35693.1 unnamed protein product [Chondrus crispus]|eukprot:XP_005715512.1 unnamed protein product [Chondrus crispus]